MNNGPAWAILNVRLMRVAPLVVVSASIAFALPAQAAGTVAGTTISNTASATYTDSGGSVVTVPSNQVDLRVDEILNVTVASLDPGTPSQVLATPGSTNQILTFNVTNTGNGPEVFSLSTVDNVGGDQFDPVTTSIVIDSNDNGIYEFGSDVIYNGSNFPLLAPDGVKRVFVLANIPGSTTDGQRGQVNLNAAAVTGTGPPGTVFAGAGTGGSDAIAGASGADDSDDGSYVVNAATVAFVKTASVLDPFGGTRSVPNAVITYTLLATVGGSGSLANLAVGDPIPANTTFQPGTITSQAVAVTDATDADAGEFAANSIAVRFGTVAAGQTRTVTFKVKIN